MLWLWFGYQGQYFGIEVHLFPGPLLVAAGFTDFCHLISFPVLLVTTWYCSCKLSGKGVSSPLPCHNGNWPLRLARALIILINWLGHAIENIGWPRNQGIRNKSGVGTINTYWTWIPIKCILSRLYDLVCWLLSINENHGSQGFRFFICSWKAQSWGFCGVFFLFCFWFNCSN